MCCLFFSSVKELINHWITFNFCQKTHAVFFLSSFKFFSETKINFCYCRNSKSNMQRCSVFARVTDNVGGGKEAYIAIAYNTAYVGNTYGFLARHLQLQLHHHVILDWKKRRITRLILPKSVRYFVDCSHNNKTATLGHTCVEKSGKRCRNRFRFGRQPRPDVDTPKNDHHMS